MLDIYVDGRPIIFTTNVGQGTVIFLCYAIYFFLFATLFFLIGRYKYNNPKKYKAFETMQNLLDENKMHLFEVREKNEIMERRRAKRFIEAVEEVKHEKMSRSLLEDHQENPLINGS